MPAKKKKTAKPKMTLHQFYDMKTRKRVVADDIEVKQIMGGGGKARWQAIGLVDGGQRRVYKFVSAADAARLGG